MTRTWQFRRILVLCGAFILAPLPLALGQTTISSGPDAASDAPALTQEDLDNLLAPIALYPDSLLSQIFMAATYPIEVVEAERWARQNEKLTGDALTRQLEEKGWDPSVKSLVNFPQVLTMMSEQLEWTTKLGDAFLAQQKEVMNTVQRLRIKAQDAGNLETNEQQKVIVEAAPPPHDHRNDPLGLFRINGKRSDRRRGPQRPKAQRDSLDEQRALIEGWVPDPPISCLASE